MVLARRDPNKKDVFVPGVNRRECELALPQVLLRCHHP